MKNNIVEIHTLDNVLLDEAMFDIGNACSKFIEMKNPIGSVLHHMADSIICYVEEYILKNEDCYGLKKPRKRK